LFFVFCFLLFVFRLLFVVVCCFVFGSWFLVLVFWFWIFWV